MGQRDRILTAISHIHAAGLDADKWPQALSAVSELVGGCGASLEFMGRPSLRHLGLYSFGLPTKEVSAYLEYYAPMCPRLPYAAHRPAGTVIYDALYTDEDEMDANPFFAEFLAPLDMRYGLGGIVTKSASDLVVAGVQIPPKQGHPSKAKIKTFGLLLPHLQQAVDVMRRLSNASHAQASFERSLDWLVDGVVMLSEDGSVRYANVAAQDIFRANDGITTLRGELNFASNNAKAKLAAAMKTEGLRDLEVEAAQSDFLVERISGGCAYVVSVRPLLAAVNESNSAAALIFLHDPLVITKTGMELLQLTLKLTASEAELANALCLGLSPDEYARDKGISQNTVYTHIRHLKEKTATRRLTQLIRKLNESQIAITARRKDI